jgi:hypothetical protein
VTRKIRRDIALITTELQAALKRETADIIVIGGLLIEAQEQLDHGKWLPWLRENFGSTTQTAENYMAAARFAAKFKTVLNLKLRPTALYLLGRERDNPDGLYSRKAIAAILKAAETEWINAERAREIAMSLLPPPPEPEPTGEIETELAAREAERAAAERAAQSEIDDILDGPPPELPPAPETTDHDVILPPFDSAVATLAQLQTKPLTSFRATAHRLDKIKAVITFLQQVADAIENDAASPVALACD